MGLLQKGTYPGVEIISSALQPGKGDDDPVIVLGFMDIQTQESINAYLYTTEKAWPYTRKKLEACGFNVADYDGDLSVLNGSDSPVVGKSVRLVVDEQEYEGKLRPKVVTIGDDVFAERMDPAAATEFTAKLRARLMTTGELKPTTSKKPAPRPAGNDKPKESVPF